MRMLQFTVGVLALLVLAGCGSVRAIQGDFASKAPQLLAVTPTQVVSGQFVDFRAQIIDVTGPNLVDEDTGRVGDVLYFWDFGGGAEPNTSIDPEPRVQIRDGARSPYSAKLVLVDGTPGGEDKSAEYDFTLFVVPLAIADVTPTTGVAGTNAIFSALVQSGIPQRYQWDFGGAASPAGSTDPSPAVMFTSTPGTYQARVIVSNNFEAAELLFTITVLPGEATSE